MSLPEEDKEKIGIDILVMISKNTLRRRSVGFWTEKLKAYNTNNLNKQSIPINPNNSNNPIDSYESRKQNPKKA